MKYQEKIFFTSQDIVTTQDAQGVELKSVANDSKYMFREETVKRNLKIVSAIFIKISFFNQMIALQKL